MEKLVIPSRLTPEFINSNKNILFIYGSSIAGNDFSGQGKACRDPRVHKLFNNVCGIPTRMSSCPKMSDANFFSDSLFSSLVSAVDQSVSIIKLRMETERFDGLVIFPNIGLGCSSLDVRAPKLYKYIRSKLDELKTTYKVF